MPLMGATASAPDVAIGHDGSAHGTEAGHDNKGNIIPSILHPNEFSQTAVRCLGDGLIPLQAHQLPATSRRTIAAPAASALSLVKAVLRGMYFMPQSGAGSTARAAGGRMRRGYGRRRSPAFPARGARMLMTPTIMVLSPRLSSVVRSRLGWAASIEIRSTFEAVSSGRNA
jgi:hypothetical protein